jgi:hypothetical protein
VFGIGNTGFRAVSIRDNNYIVFSCLTSNLHCQVASHLPSIEGPTVSRASYCVLAPARSATRGVKAVARGFTLLACLLACVPLPLCAQQSTAAEYRSKANFLATFPSFVDWPEAVFSSEQSPVVICVRGDFSFGTVLAELARNSSVHGRREEVRWVHTDQELRNCQIAFISRSEAKRYTRLLQTVEGTGMLTVGETPNFLAAGGIISLAVENEALQFEVNLLAADHARVKISSRLLTLARRIVHRTEGAKS